MDNSAPDNKISNPFRHYLDIYRKLDPKEIAQRCNLEFDHKTACFSLRILGAEYLAPHPGFALLPPAIPEESASGDKELINTYEKILFLRYLCEGKYLPEQGKNLSYNEIPWGDVYYHNFEGRCLRRCASVFGRDVSGFSTMMNQNRQLRAEQVNFGDVSFRFEFLNGFFVTIILWQADDEFPPSAQILFSDNIVFAFSAEDLAVAGEIIIDRLSKIL